MPALEVVFIVLVSLLILRLLIARIRSQGKLLPILAAGCLVLILVFVVHGFRWQLIPAFIVFLVLAISSRSSRNPGPVWRTLAAVPLVLLLGLSSFLSYQLPVFKMPKPTGPYAVGTFYVASVDSSRVERFNPQRNRELGVTAWYPANAAQVDGFQRAGLWGSLHEGDLDLSKFLTHYFSRIETSSFIEAPISQEGPFPVVIFNHGMNAWSEQNTTLMEQLASNGYVVLSIAHTYQSTRVRTKESGTVLLISRIPDDLEIEPLDENGQPRSSYGVIGTRALESGEEYSLLHAELYKLFDAYQALQTEESRKALVADAIRNREQYRISSAATSANLYNFLYGRMTVMGSFVDIWVKDIQFVLEQLPEMETPVQHFSVALNLERLAVIGHSVGSSAAGGFCKIDRRCKAGVHLDGNYSGYSWDKPLMAPFMVFYSSYFYEANNFAYLGSGHDLWNFTHPGLDHMDFTDLPLALPNLTAQGMSGTIDPRMALSMVNRVTLDFLDRYLKNKSRSLDVYGEYPELQARKY